MAWRVAAAVHIISAVAMLLALSMIEQPIQSCYGTVLGGIFKTIVFAIYLKYTYASVKWNWTYFASVFENAEEETEVSQDCESENEQTQNRSAIVQTNTSLAQECEADVKAENTHTQENHTRAVYVKLSEMTKNENCLQPNGKRVTNAYISNHLNPVLKHLMEHMALNMLCWKP